MEFTYLTILHKITLWTFLFILLIFIFFSLRQKDKKLILPMIFSSFLVVGTLTIFSIFVLDKYTKKAKLLRVKHQRVLLNESITVSGVVKNVGKFKIGKCKLEVKIASNPMAGKNLSGSAVFNPKASISEMFSNKENGKKTSVVKEFDIAYDLDPGVWKPFSVSMKFPTYLKNPYLKYKLYCH